MSINFRRRGSQIGGVSFALMAVAIIGLVVFGNWRLWQPSAPAATPSPPADLSASARYMCKDFIVRSGYRVPDFGPWPGWAAVDNLDGTWSVGARFMGAAPGGDMRNLYVSCVMVNSGDSWSLVSLSRLQ